MSEFRRRLMMAGEAPSPYDEYGYIKDGKVFHVDGIVKGNTADAWTDLVSGIALTKYGNVTSLANGWDFGGTTADYFRNNGFPFPDTYPYTTEVVVKPDMETSSVVFATYQGTSGAKYRPIALLYASGNIRVTNPYNSTSVFWASGVTNGNNYTISGNKVLCYVNGASVALDSNNNARYNMDGQSGYVRISGRFRSSTPSAPYKGIVYAIRVYNRELTAAEMLHNQQVDNERFNLGLNI